jgi:hypothetical protein
VRRLTTRVLLFALSITALTGCYKNPVISPPFPPSPATRLYVGDNGNGLLIAYGFPLGPTSAPLFTLTGSVADSSGVATDRAGNLYVAHFNEATIDVYNPPISATSTPAFTMQLASSCGPTVKLPNSSGISFDAAGDLWVAGELGGQMYMLPPPFAGGCVVPNFFNAAPALSGPVIGVFDRAGDLIVAEFGGSTMLVFRPPFAFAPGSNVAAATMPLPSQLGGAGISIQDQLVVGLNDGRVAFFNPPFATGNTPAFYIPASGNAGVRNMIFSGGNLYVPYAGSSKIGVFSPPFSGLSTPTFTFTTGLSFPYGLAIGS